MSVPEPLRDLGFRPAQQFLPGNLNVQRSFALAAAVAAVYFALAGETPPPQDGAWLREVQGSGAAPRPAAAAGGQRRRGDALGDRRCGGGATA